MERVLRLTGPQRLVLRIVSSNPGIGAGELARALHLHPSTLTGVLRRLERQHLLRRHRDLGDARRALLTITPTGMALVARHTGTVEEAVARLLRSQPRTRILAVRRVLGTLSSFLVRAGTKA
jgi:MarR family transcriptional regulator, organic hydroperoxide resistance regulator